MEIFISGIIQGSRPIHDLHAQDYRETIKAALRQYLPEATIVCPWELHPNSASYDDTTARATFFFEMEAAGRADAIVSYLPEASMGSAIELWEAHRHGALVFIISPMRDNWTVKFLASRLFPDLPAFSAFVASGEMAALLHDLVEKRQRRIIWHITRREMWEIARRAGSYRGDTLDAVGFIHCSTQQQAVRVANSLFRGQKGLVLLGIQTDKVKVEVRFESVAGEGLFPHIYGPLNLDAVIQVLDFEPGADGLFAWPQEAARVTGRAPV